MFFPIEDYYDIVVDKKIQAVVDELKKLPHDVLIRNMTYWMDYLDEGKYVVESDFPHEEWFVDCEHYAAATTDEERYKYAKSMAQTLGHMLQDIKLFHPNKYPAAMRAVKSWKKYLFVGFSATMKEEIDKAWIEPQTCEDVKKAAYAYVPLLKTIMSQVEEGQDKEAAGNAFYLLERLCRLYCSDFMLFESNRDNDCSYYEYLLEAVCHILVMVMERTIEVIKTAMIWHLNGFNMLYGRIFESLYSSFEDLINGEADEDTFVYEYDYLVNNPTAFTTK